MYLPDLKVMEKGNARRRNGVRHLKQPWLSFSPCPLSLKAVIRGMGKEQYVVIAAGSIIFMILAVAGLIFTSRRKNRGVMSQRC
jgi:hypothetical protein